MTSEEENQEDISKISQGKDRSVTRSKKVTDHLANERTFLAWIRTGLATMTFGFVIERFGLLLRELGLRNRTIVIFSVPFSAIIGVSLTLLGVVVIIMALLNFLQIRSSIDAETFHPPIQFAIFLTVFTSLIGLLLAIYLILTVQ